MPGSRHVLRRSLMYWPLQPGEFARWRTSPSRGTQAISRSRPRTWGMVGWSGGGNRAVLTMARYGDRFPGLKWYASWESPMLGSLDTGTGSIFQRNPYYDRATGTRGFRPPALQP